MYNCILPQTNCIISFSQSHCRGTPPCHAYSHTRPDTRESSSQQAWGHLSTVMWRGIIDPFYLVIKTSVRGVVTGVSVRTEGECVSGWDRLRDRRGDPKGQWLSRRGLRGQHYNITCLHSCSTRPAAVQGGPAVD